MLRIIYPATVHDPDRGWAYVVKAESDWTDATPLVRVMAVTNPKLSTPLPSWFLGPWYRCIDCDKRCLEWKQRPALVGIRGYVCNDCAARRRSLIIRNEIQQRQAKTTAAHQLVSA